MTEPRREALHALAHELVTQDVTCSRQATQDLARGYLTLEAEVERLRAKAAIVDAMDSGRIAAFSKRKDGRVALYTPEHLQDFDAEPFVADTITAAYTAATREGTDAE